MADEIDTRAIGPDTGLVPIRWLTATGNLPSRLRDGLETPARNLRRAQDAVAERLLRQLPTGRQRFLDIADSVAPSIDLDRQFFSVCGPGLVRSQRALRRCRPPAPWLLVRARRLFRSERRRRNLTKRRTGTTRSLQGLQPLSDPEAHRELTKTEDSHFNFSERTPKTRIFGLFLRRTCGILILQAALEAVGRLHPTPHPHSP